MTTFTIIEASDQKQWDDFLASEPYTPFLQSWAMGEVYKAIGQLPMRLVVRRGDETVGICFGHVVPARRGKHIAVPYGPLVRDADALQPLLDELKRVAVKNGCSFIRVSPFWAKTSAHGVALEQILERQSKPSPMHVLAEHLWYLPLTNHDQWKEPTKEPVAMRLEDEIFASLRSTTRNLIRRATKEGVTIEASNNPLRDLDHFLKLHEETRKRHGFTPYTNAFFRAQVEHFAHHGQVTLYLAHYQNQVIASSIHIHAFGETSYHHGASTHAFAKIPASYLLQWTAIQDALKRGDHVYNFWGIAPVDMDSDGKTTILNKNHPFSGVTLFKTGFGGNLLPLTHCRDIPLNASYYLTRAFEYLRKWKRGF